MTNFKINESEKNRIRGLHKNYSIIKEQDINVEVEPVGVDPMGPIDDKPTLQADDDKVKSTTTTQPTTQPTTPSNIPCQQIYNQVQSVNALPYWNNALTNGMIPGICHKCTTHHNSWVQAGSPMPVPQNTDWHMYGAAGQQVCLLLINNPQCCTPAFDCTTGPGSCSLTPGGQYSTMADCQQNCTSSTTHYCIDCVQQIMSTYQTPGSCPQGMVDIGTSPSPNPGPCWDCQTGTCQPGWVGENTQQDCQQTCTQSFACVNGNCQPDPNGPYSSMNACNVVCSQSSYDCAGSTPFGPPSACNQVSGSGGQYPTLDDCLTSPCACDDVISVWPLYLNNPNLGSGSGTWYGSPHDGPSNSNAIQNQLNNLQGNPNFPGGNPTQQHKMKCKEAAMQFWLANSANYACCSEAMWGTNPVANGGNGDTLGCVSQQWINLMNNFVTNSPNWPNQGCDWLNTALANVTAQQQNFQPGGGGWCKTQGKIDFINNFKQFGTSTYVNGNASFPLPCV
tara:strand:+ start:950 stop:2467 length:1518 start_codon:yes stop_codon:yes gene_type:complete